MDLYKTATRFRRAIEAAKANGELGEFFREFPTCQCGNTSDMLSQFLLDNGVGPITYVNGTYYGNAPEKFQCHTWLVVDHLVIDITADQFKYYDGPLKNTQPVYVGPMNDYYRLFEIRPGGKCAHTGLQTYWSNYHELKLWYDTILKYYNL